MQSVDGLVEHLFRRESGRILSALTRILGPQQLARAEDVVQDVLCRALEVWKFRGVPENPSAWLMLAAKNRVIDLLRRDQTARAFASMFEDEINSITREASDPAAEALFNAEAIQDDQLRMMFACCDPSLPEDAQVGLMLNILCGFSIDEIASAFLATHAAIEKRVGRAKKVLADSSSLFELKEADVAERLPAVHRAIYLLFNEGYHGANQELPVRSELCREALFLVTLLQDHPIAGSPATYGLSALMLLLAARLPSRINSTGNLMSLEHQDRSNWDADLIAKGHEHLEKSAVGSALTEYHIEAAIAAIHCAAPRFEETQWGAIVELYDELLALRPTAVVALNRAIAVGQLEGPQRGLEAIAGIQDSERLKLYPFYWAAMGELELRLSRLLDAKGHFAKAQSLARNAGEGKFFRGRIDACNSPESQ